MGSVGEVREQLAHVHRQAAVCIAALEAASLQLQDMIEETDGIGTSLLDPAVNAMSEAATRCHAGIQLIAQARHEVQGYAGFL